MKHRILLAILGLAILPFAAGQMCAPSLTIDSPAADNGGNGDGDTTDGLTDQEKAAVVAACTSPGAINQGAQTAQNGTSDLDDSGQTLPNGATFGTCPQVTKTGAVGTGLELTIDFGTDPCTALVIEDDTYTCSGNATGTFSLVNQSMGLGFDHLECNGVGIDGTAEISFELLQPGVSFEGSWDLTWYYENELIGTDGDGIVSYVPATGCCDVTSIQQFTGSVTEDGYVWSLTMEDILVSLERYLSFIPYSGSITVDGPEIRALTITFNENSPVTGELTICIENGRCLTTTLEELEEWADALLGEVDTE